jgi:hypothetical protein
MLVQKDTTGCRWLAIADSRNSWLLPDLNRNGSNEECTDVTLGLSDVIVCFGFCLSYCRRDHVDPGSLLMGVLAETLFQSEIEESSVEAIESRCCRVKSDDGWFQLGFAFQFLIGLIDTVQIGVALLPCPVQLCPEMVENLLEPAITREFPGANFVFVIYMRLLELHPVVAETASKQMGPANVVLGMYEERKAGFLVVGRHVEHGIVLKSTLDA